MALNAFRGDVDSRSKVLTLIAPNNVQDISPTILINNKQLAFEDWTPVAIAAAINESAFPEFTNLAATSQGGGVVITGLPNTDFDLRYTQRPTAKVENIAGVSPVSQRSQFTFNGATSGTYTITVNGETTAAIAISNIADARTKLEALASLSDAHFDLTASGSDFLMTFKGPFAAVPVVVSVNGAGLQNPGGTLSVERTQSATLERYDTYAMSMNASTSAVIAIDGNSDTIYVDDALSVVRQKIQAMATGGRLINVYGGQLGDAGMTAAFWIIEFAGYGTTVRPAFSVFTSSGPNSCQIASVYDPTVPGDGAEQVLIDFSSMVLPDVELNFVVDGKSVTLLPSNTAAEIATTFGNASRYAEWVGKPAVTFPTPASLDVIDHPLIKRLSWARATLYQGGNVPDSYIRKTSNSGTFKVFVQGGSLVAGARYSISRSPADILAGTFVMSFLEGVTIPIAFNAAATAIEAAMNSVVTGALCTGGIGTGVNPWQIILPSTSTNPDQIPTLVSAFMRPGSAHSSSPRNANAGSSASAIVTVSVRAIGGTYQMRFGPEGPVHFAPGMSATAFKTMLLQFASLANTEDTTVTYDASNGTYGIAFVNGMQKTPVHPFLMLSLVSTLVTDEAETNARVDVLPTGHGAWNDPDNWTLRRLPEYGDVVVLDDSENDILYGLRQFVRSSSNVATSEFTAVGGHDFLPNQKVRLFGSPVQFVLDTDYFVVSPDYSRGTFLLSETSNGPAIDILTSETGTVFVGVMVDSIRIESPWTDMLGLPEWNSLGFREYRNRYLKLGVKNKVDIGEGNSRGSALILLDFGISSPVIRVVTTSSPFELIPSVNILAASNEIRVGVLGGVVGVAAGDDEESTIGDIGVHSGEFFAGKVTVARDVLIGGGSLRSRELTVLGVVRIN